MEEKSTAGQEEAKPEYIRNVSVQKAALNHSQSSHLCSNSIIFKCCSHESPLCATASLVVKCCFLYVPTLTELSRTLLNECIYSRIPTDTDGGGWGRSSVPVCAQCTLVALRSSHCTLVFRFVRDCASLYTTYVCSEVSTSVRYRRKKKTPL